MMGKSMHRFQSRVAEIKLTRESYNKAVRKRVLSVSVLLFLVLLPILMFAVAAVTNRSEIIDMIEGDRLAGLASLLLLWGASLTWWIRLVRDRSTDAILDRAKRLAGLKRRHIDRLLRSLADRVKEDQGLGEEVTVEGAVRWWRDGSPSLVRLQTARAWWDLKRTESDWDYVTSGTGSPLGRLVAARALRALRSVACVGVIGGLLGAVAVLIVSSRTGILADFRSDAGPMIAFVVVYSLIWALLLLVWIGLLRMKEIDETVKFLEGELEQLRVRGATWVAGNYGLDLSHEVTAQVVRRIEPRRVRVSSGNRVWVVQEDGTGWRYIKRPSLM